MTISKYLLLLWVIIIVVALLSACNGESELKPDDLIPEETYIHLLIELEMAHSFKVLPEDSVYVVRLLDGVFDHYGITLEQFEKSHQWYERDTHEQLRRYRRAIDKLNELTLE
jgi:hypothetical protein